MDQNLQKQWSELVRRTPMKKADIQSDEEMFSMAYASTYSKRPPVTYYKPEWIHFIKQLS